MDNSGFTLQFDSIKESKWQRLLDEIDNGNVIPVIGPDLLVEPKLSHDNNKTENLHQQLISYIASQTNVKSAPRTFSQLLYDDNYRRAVRYKNEQIYYLIAQILNNVQFIEEIDTNPSKLLKDLLGTKKFPFVITTSFTPVVENAMREIWGEVKVLNFNNNPRDSVYERGGDIGSMNDLKQPTVYYMFGKYCNNEERFVVTDNDIMTFCCSWIKNHGVPKNLAESLKRKFFLILGNSYSDWLFRFVWYGLRSTTRDMKSDVVVNENAEETLKQFLERIEALFQENPREVVAKIKKDVEERMQTRTANKVYTTDVFLSYSHSDSAFIQKLKDKLAENGITVWFDNDSIGDWESWKEAINVGINNTRLFVPLLTKNIENEIFVPHEYRIEWKIAAGLAQKMGGRKFIAPIVEKGFDFYNPLTKVPQEFAEKNAAWFSTEKDVDYLTNIIINELEVLKEMETKFNN